MSNSFASIYMHRHVYQRWRTYRNICTFYFFAGLEAMEIHHIDDDDQDEDRDAATAVFRFNRAKPEVQF
jgi:hypothetical protein